MRPISLLTFTASRAGTVVRSSAPLPGEQSNHRSDELVEGEDGRGGEARQHDDRAPAADRETDRLAGLEGDAVRDDAGIVELGDDAIRHVARAFAGAARQQHDVGERQARAEGAPAGDRRHPA